LSKVIAVVSARMASRRCPGKAMALLAGRPLLQHLLERLLSVKELDGVVLATSEASENHVLVELAETLGVGVFAGDEEDVLGRYVEVARRWQADDVVRVTADNPLTDLSLIRSLVALHRRERADYTYVPGDALLMGILPEVISRQALEQSHRDGEDRHRSELVTLYIKENPERFRIAKAELSESLYRPAYRLTVDEPPDLELMEEIFDRLYRPGEVLETAAAIRLLDEEPGLVRINGHLRHGKANLRSVELDNSNRQR
jgi:spore coat polysaccharide biosynthesis protein SpsF